MIESNLTQLQSRSNRNQSINLFHVTMKYSVILSTLLFSIAQSFSNAEYIHVTQQQQPNKQLLHHNKKPSLFYKKVSYTPRRYTNNSINNNRYFTSPYPTIPYTPDVKEWRTTNTKKRRASPQDRYTRNLNRKKSGIFSENVSTNLLLANVVTFVGQTINPKITSMGAKVSDVILRGKELHRLGTAMFLHGGVAHLAVNCYSLMNIGPQVESVFGRKRLFATYIVSGISGNVLSSVMSKNPSVGASGAIFGLISAYYVFLNRNSVFFGQSAENGMSSVRQTLLVNVVLGLSNPVVDNWGHLGGAIGGAMMAYAFGPRLFVMTGGPFGGDPTSRRVIVDDPLVRIPKFGRFPNEMKSNKMRR